MPPFGRRLSLDQNAVRRMLHGRGSHVNRMLGGFASIATTEVRRVADERIYNVNKPWTRTGNYKRRIHSRVHPSDVLTVTADADYSIYLEHGIPPHSTNYPRVVFMRGFGFRYMQDHPGTPALNILRDGIRRSGRQLNRLASTRG